MDQPKETEMAGNPRLYSSWAIFCRHGNGEAAMEKNEAAMGVGDPVMGVGQAAMGKIYPPWEKMRSPWDWVTRHGQR